MRPRTTGSRTSPRLNSSDAWRLRNGSATSDLRRRNQQPTATSRGTRSNYGNRTTGRSGTGRASTGRAGTGRSGTGRASTGRSGTGRASTGRSGTGRASTGRSSSGRGNYNSNYPGRASYGRSGFNRAGYRSGHSGRGRHGYSRYGYYGHGRGHGHGSHYYHDYYRHHGFSLSFSFGYGSYIGLSYHYPYRHYGYGIDYAFFYPAAVSYAYVPYGFYCDAPVTYVERVADTYPTTEVRYVESEEPVQGDKELEPVPAAGTPAAEKFLREGSELFRKGDYYEAAKQFRLAALSASDQPGPLFALGQSLIALGSDTYAARVIRRAVTLAPGLVKEPGDIVGVYPSQEEFDKALTRMQTLAERRGPASDAAFLVAVQRYFSGHPRAKDDFVRLAMLLPDDQVVALFAVSAEKRFTADLPEITR